MAIEEWRFFVTYVYNGHLRGPWHSFRDTLAVVLTPPVLHDLGNGYVIHKGSNTQPSACEANALTHCVTAAIFGGSKIFTENTLEQTFEIIFHEYMQV